MEYNYPSSPPGGRQYPQMNNDDHGPENVEHSSSAYVSSVPRYSLSPSSPIAGGLESWDSSSHPTFSADQFPPGQIYEPLQCQPAPSGEPQEFSPANQSSLAQDFGDLSIESSRLDRNVDLWSPSVFSTGGFSTTSLHQSYFLRQNEGAFFIPGRVFSCLWTETVGAMAKNTNGDHFSDIPLGLKAYSDIQRFVVVRPILAQHFSLCLPIKTYGSKGSGKFGFESHLQHAIIYTGDTEPQRLKAEQQFNKIPIRMLPATLRDALRPQSRLNFGRPTPVDHNHYVKYIGDIDKHHLETLLKYYDEEHCVRLSPESATSPHINPPPLPSSLGSIPVSPGLEDGSSLFPATNTLAFADTEPFTASGGPRLSQGHSYSNEPTQPYLQLDQHGTGYGYQPSVSGGPASMLVPIQDSFSTYETNRPPLSSSLKGKEAQRNRSQTTPESSTSAPGSNQRSKHPPRGSSVSTLKEEDSKKNKKPPRRK